MSLYTDLIEAGVDVSNWQSDMYAPVSDAVRSILAKYTTQTRSIFMSNVDGKPWYEFPFAYDPFWEARKPRTST